MEEHDRHHQPQCNAAHPAPVSAQGAPRSRRMVGGHHREQGLVEDQAFTDGADIDKTDDVPRDSTGMYMADATISHQATRNTLLRVRRGDSVAPPAPSRLKARGEPRKDHATRGPHRSMGEQGAGPEGLATMSDLAPASTTTRRNALSRPGSVRNALALRGRSRRETGGPCEAARSTRFQKALLLRHRASSTPWRACPSPLGSRPPCA